VKTYDSNAIYAQYLWPDEKPLDRWFRIKKYNVLSRLSHRASQSQVFFEALGQQEGELARVSEYALAKELWQSQRQLRAAILNNREGDPSLIRALAIVRELCSQMLGMRLHDVQMQGAMAMLMGRIAEMQTGEGKSLTAVPVAVIAAVAGFPIHIITVNEYLAERDTEEFAPVYNALGLECGLIRGDMSPQARSVEYRKAIVYCTNKDIAFDYLKDKIAFEHFNQRGRHLLAAVDDPEIATKKSVLAGLHFALIDEADSILADDAGTPLIISRAIEMAQQEDVYRCALSHARHLEEGTHFKLDRHHKLIVWSPRGESAVADIASELGGLWSGPLRARELLGKALSALYLYESGKEYAVHEDKVQIIDEYTGRRMPDRSWEGGLHQLIELKEGVDVTPPKETLAKTTYQKFFRRYWRIAGMSGTISEIADELNATYGVGARVIPTDKPLQRMELPPVVFASEQEKNHYLLIRIKEIHGSGQPILIGTRSIVESEQLSALLDEHSIVHRVLNAVQDKEEADIVAVAGQLGRVTVATNMAGRGTDIKLTEQTMSLGGLYVIATGIHDSRRIDRQLCGRCARQGDPGSYQLLCSFEDDIPQRFLSGLVQAIGRRTAAQSSSLGQRAAFALIRFSQSRAEKSNYLLRKDLMNTDDRLSRSLSFTGLLE